MFVKAILATLVLASSTFGLASPHMHKRGVHNHHAHMVARTPIPVIRSAETVNPLRRRHQRTKRCQNRPQTPDASAPVNIQAVNSKPAQPQQPPKSDPPAQSDPAPAPPAQPAQPAQPDPPSAPSPPSGGSYGETLTGDGTFYDTGLGACGITNVNTDFIAAVAHELFDSYPGYAGPGSNPNNNPICGKVVTASFEGKSVTVTITDRCGGCSGRGDLDFSPAAFNQLADPARGRIHGITWQFPL